MDIGVNAVPDVSDVAYAELVEQLGFSSFYLGDNPLMWSDTYAALALVADRTERVRIGSSVAVAGVRSPMVTANAIASINRIAPGRVSCAVGTGNTARRVMGKAPLKLSSFEAWVRELKPLLAGEEVEQPGRDGSPIPVGHVMKDTGFVAFEPKIPLYVSGFGPKAMAMAGVYGDGLIGALSVDPGYAEICWGWIRDGAAAAGREIEPETFYTGTLTTMVVLEDGEAIDSPRVIEEAGSFALTSLHYAYEQHRLLGAEPPPFVAEVWEEYAASIEATPPERHHQRIHEGHNTWLLESEKRFVTPALLEATSLIGTATEIVERLRALAATGLVDELMIVPAPDVAKKVVTDVAEQVLPLYGQVAA